jgi:hypothetical protein
MIPAWGPIPREAVAVMHLIRPAAARMFARAEWPFATLGLLALSAPVVVLAQGGDWALALLAFPAVLAVPGAAIEAMLGLARAALWIEATGSQP